MSTKLPRRQSDVALPLGGCTGGLPPGDSEGQLTTRGGGASSPGGSGVASSRGESGWAPRVAGRGGGSLRRVGIFATPRGISSVSSHDGG